MWPNVFKSKNKTDALTGQSSWYSAEKCWKSQQVARTGPYVSSATGQKGQKRNILWRIPKAVVMATVRISQCPQTWGLLWQWFTLEDVLSWIVSEHFDLEDANGLFFCVLKIHRTPRCLLEADKQVETGRGLYFSFVPCFYLKSGIELSWGNFVQIRKQTPFLPLHWFLNFCVCLPCSATLVDALLISVCKWVL